MGVSRMFRGGVAVGLLRLSQFVEIFGCRVNRLFQKKVSFFREGFGASANGDSPPLDSESCIEFFESDSVLQTAELGISSNGHIVHITNTLRRFVLPWHGARGPFFDAKWMRSMAIGRDS